VVCTGGSCCSFARSFSDEPEVEANQKQGEMYEATIKQNSGVIAENPKKEKERSCQAKKNTSSPRR
jgi:hypothetical protein